MQSTEQHGDPTISHPGVPDVLGRYELLGALGKGGMATVYLARLVGEAGFNRLYAVKVLHPHLAEEEAFVTMLLDEARIAARLHHPSVVPVVDLGSQAGLHYIVMEYVEGCPLSALLRSGSDRPPRLIVPIILDSLAGLHAAHVLADDDGNPLKLVHRDVSPQNVLVGVDGTGRITDFGVARAESSIHNTRPGQIKGKLSFLAPEQVKGQPVDCRTDVYAAGVMLWTALTGRKLFTGETDAATMMNILQTVVPAPSTVGLMPHAALDEVCLKALERDPDKRYSSAQEMEDALRSAASAAGLLAPKREVAAWVTKAFGQELATRREAVRAALRRDRNGSQPSMSGMRVIPTVGETTPSSSAASAQHVGAPPANRFVPLAIIGAVLTVAGAGLAAWLVTRSAPAAPNPRTELVAVTSAQPTTTASPRVAPVATGPTTTTSASAPTAASPTAVASAPVATVVRRPWTAPAAPAKPSATPTTPTAPPQPTTQRAWDPNSPLPPP